LLQQTREQQLGSEKQAEELRKLLGSVSQLGEANGRLQLRISEEEQHFGKTQE